jgi:glycosyltransferase involved in cell wall biosynthesis
VTSFELFIHLIVLLISCAVLITWVYFFFYSRRSLKYAPALRDVKKVNFLIPPRVSIIIAALNEEKYIRKCLESLLAQDYPNLEIISVDDGSTDSTFEIMKTIASKEQRLRVFNADQRPAGWVGKNWPCYIGYNKSAGDILIFTDADTVHSGSTVTLAVNHMACGKLSALTVIPKLLSNDLLTSFTLPLLSIFLQTRFSPLMVNDPTNKVGYFFGSFFAISRDIYEEIGTHREVRTEIIEDGALGALVKKRGIKMKMFRGENFVSALWARDKRTLWNGLLRLLVPLHKEHGKKTILMVIAIFFLMLFPFVTALVGMVCIYQCNSGLLTMPLTVTSLIIVSLITATSVLIESESIQDRIFLAFGSPVGAMVITISFIFSLLNTYKSESFVWKGRRYEFHSSV